MVEVIFSRPGLGVFLVDAIEARDFPKVQAVVMVTALLFVTSRLLHGARWSLGLAFLVSVISLCIGTLFGLIAALGGKKADWLVMRTTDTFLAFPELVAAVVIAGVLGAGTGSLIFALSVTGWMRYCRVARGVGLTLKTRGYVVQAKLAGMSAISIARWHYLPALLPSLAVVWTGMFVRSTPLQMIWPGLAVVVCVLSINLVGDALRDALANEKSAA